MYSSWSEGIKADRPTAWQNTISEHEHASCVTHECHLLQFKTFRTEKQHREAARQFDTDILWGSGRELREIFDEASVAIYFGLTRMKYKSIWMYVGCCVTRRCSTEMPQILYVQIIQKFSNMKCATSHKLTGLSQI